MSTKLQQVYVCSMCGNTVEVVQPSGGTLTCCNKSMNESDENSNDVSGEKHVILGVHITDRVKHVPTVQGVLTQFGCNIKTRIGLHHVNESFCSPNGLMIIEFVGDDSHCASMISQLSALAGVQVKRMVFGHP
jgi:desulfoferrodoxin-like iron-binding protein